MKIVTISDTHNKHESIDIPKSDIILFTGDCSGRGNYGEVKRFCQWYGSLKSAFKVMVCGNHDWGFQKDPRRFERLCKDNNIIYLNDTSTVIMGVKIHGSPVTPKFCNWAFNRSTTISDSMDLNSQRLGHSYIGNHWDLIPKDTDILLTHGPPEGVFDVTDRGDTAGCPVLMKKIKNDLNLKIHVFGHIHEGRGVYVDHNINKNKQSLTFVNTSCLTSRYKPQLDKTFVFDWDYVKNGVSVGRD